MGICSNNSPLSVTQLPYHSDSYDRIVTENTYPEDHSDQTISINSFRCNTTVCEIITFANSFCKDFLPIVRSSSEELQKSSIMYGAFNSSGNANYNGTVKYYSPTDLSKIVRQNIDFNSKQESDNFIRIPRNCDNTEQEKITKYPKGKSVEQKSKKKPIKEKKKDKIEDNECVSSGVNGMMSNQEETKRKADRTRKHKKKELSELKHSDLQCLINDCNENTSIPFNSRKERHREFKKRRSCSIDQIPTKDVTSDNNILIKPERPKSAERKDIPRIDKKKEFCMKYYLPNTPSNSFQIYEQEQAYITPNQLVTNHFSTKKQREKSKTKKKTYGDIEIPEFITLDQINEQTMNLKDEKFEYLKPHRWEAEKKICHHQQREFYRDYDQQEYRHILESHNNGENFNLYSTNPNEYNEIIQNHYGPTDNYSDVNRMKVKERKNEKNNRKKTTDNEYKAMKKYIKKLAKDQQKEIYYLTRKDKVESIQDRRVHRDRRFLEENLLKFDQNFDQNYENKNTDFTSGRKVEKEFIPLELGLEELALPPRTRRKKHDHKKKKNKKETKTSESVQRMRSTSLSLNTKHQNLNDLPNKNGEFTFDETESSSKKCKSETIFNSTIDDKNVVWIYRNKVEKEGKKTIKLAKKQECLAIDKAKKYNKRRMKEHEKKKDTEPSIQDKNQMILPAEHNDQISDVVKMQQRSLNFQKAMTKDFLSRPKPRLSRSRQRSSKYLVKLEDDQNNNNNLGVDDQPIKEVHCYDVGTSTILDNNFGDLLELLKREPLMKPLCSNKKKSVFHVKKNDSREDLVESSRKAYENGDRTLGIVVKGIEPPKKIETKKVRSRFKFPSEKSKLNRLKCKMLSVVAIPPNQFYNAPDIDQNTMKIHSTPHMMHESNTEKRNSDKRLERLLKYYKVDAQSNINNETKTGTSTKSIKALIANKLSDYLKKLQEDDNDELLLIQTDDPTVIKLILPVDLAALECSNSSAFDNSFNGQSVKNPKESFSDIYINYTADNMEEDNFGFNSVELPKHDKRICSIEKDELNLKKNISNESFDSKSTEPKSIILFNQRSLNFSYSGSRSEFPVSPRITENFNRISSQFEAMREFSSEGNQRFDPNSSNNRLVQQKRMIMNDRQYHSNKHSYPAFCIEEENWNSASKTGNSKVKNLKYKNSQPTDITKNYTKNNENEINNKRTMEASRTATTKRKNEEEASVENFQSNKKTLNNIPVEQTSDKLYINEIKAENKESTKIYRGMVTCNDEEAIPNNGGFKENQYNSQYPTESEINEKYNSVNNFEMSCESSKQNPSQIVYKKKYEYSEQKENERRYSRINTKKNCPLEAEQAVDDICVEKFKLQKKASVGKAMHSQPPMNFVENSPPTRGYEYFEIPLPKPSKKTRSKMMKDSEHEKNENVNQPSVLKPEYQKINSPPFDPSSNKNSQIPKRISNVTKTTEDLLDFPPKVEPKKKIEEPYKEKFYGNIETTSWNNRNEKNDMDNSLEKCLHWNIKNSDTVVVSEFFDSAQNMRSETEQSTTVPAKSNIPVPRKDQTKFQSNQGKSPCIGNDNNTTMFLTKSYKIPPGQSSYEKRKLYDTRIRKNVKKRSRSECSGQTNKLPLIYEVRYCNVYNQCSPNAFDLEGSKSDQNLSSFSTDLDIVDLPKSIETLTTTPSCYLKENIYDEDGEELSTDPSCFLRCSEHEKYEEDLSTDPSCLLKESKYAQDVENYPICSYLLKDSKYEITSRNKEGNFNLPLKKNLRNGEETSKYQSLRDGRIKELIKENLLYSNYRTQNKNLKLTIEAKKRKTKVEKRNNSSETKLICFKEYPGENGNIVKISAKPKEYRNNEENETNKNDSQQCQKLTKLSIDKVTENKLLFSFEEQKLSTVDNETVLIEKPVVKYLANSELSNDKDSSVSSRSTLVNCEACPSITSEESKETVKEREIIVTSADDSGYLTRDVERSITNFHSTNDGKGFSQKQSEEKCTIPRKKQIIEKNFKWNQQDLGKLRVQLLFPHVYDDFELLEKARNTDLIKYYVESENGKLKEAIDSISQKKNMSIKSRSVMSLPSVKMIPEEPSFSGDVSEHSYKKQQGGFFNYQKFIAQSNKCYSTSLLKKLSKPEVCGDCADSFVKGDITETCSVKSCNISSVNSSVTIKKSVIELFKLRPSSAKKSSCSILSDNDTLIEENEGECLSMNNNISDEEFFHNFHQIMAIECQRYAKKVRDKAETKNNTEDNLEYEEIPLDCLLKNKNLNVESSEDYLEQEFQLASDEICIETNASSESIKKESNESFKSLTCIKSKKSNSKWRNLLKKSSPVSNSKFNLDFYPQERMSILDLIKSVQASSISEDSLICSPRDKVLSVIPSGEVTKQSEKQFFDNLLAFYDKESEFIKKLIRDDEFFSSLIENIRNSEDTTQLMLQKDVQKKMKKEKKKGIFSRFFRWKEKKSTENLFENPSIGKSLEFAKSMSIESSSFTRESCYSFYKDLEDLEKDINDVNHPNSDHLQQLAHKAKCHLEPMVKASISNRHISDRVKLTGFLKILDLVAKGDFTFLNNSDNKTLEERLRDHVAQMFEKVYRIANLEVAQKSSILDHDKIQLLKMLVTKYHMGIESHINILGIYIGRGLIQTRMQLEDAIIYLMGQDSQEINYEQLAKHCSIESG